MPQSSSPNPKLDQLVYLIWSDGGVTYRLESHLSPAEALAVAESLETFEDTFENRPPEHGYYSALAIPARQKNSRGIFSPAIFYN
ncbi:MAG: hypothetical protein R6X32_21015 [Chloroflexota bacterium]